MLVVLYRAVVIVGGAAAYIYLGLLNTNNGGKVKQYQSYKDYKEGM